MKTNPRVSPEQHELDAKRAELERLEDELAQRELDLRTLQSELCAFEATYFRVLGPKFTERDVLTAQIAEARLSEHATDAHVNAARSGSQFRSAESRKETSHRVIEGTNESFTPTDNLKRLYREIAKLVHPDLTTDVRERDRRNRLMAEANRAFSEGDEARLKSILEEWETSPEFVEGEGIGPELVRTIRKIYQVNRRLAKIDEEADKLKGSDWYALKQESDAAWREGRDLLAEQATALDWQIGQLGAQLDTLRKRSTRVRPPARESRTKKQRSVRRAWIGSRPRVLIVEHDPRVRELLIKTLDLADFEVDHAPNGFTALAALRRQAYDLLTVELKIPDMEGLTLIREAQRLRSNIAIVIITAHPTEISAIEAINLGVAGYVTKPFKVPQVIAAALSALLRSGWREASSSQTVSA